MTDSILWFRTPGGVRFHAKHATSTSARCSARYQSKNANLFTPGALPMYAQLCAACLARIESDTQAAAHLFNDWDGDGTRLELIDNADSISLQVSLTGNNAVQLELGVRIAPDDLDRLQQWITDVRQRRGI